MLSFQATRIGDIEIGGQAMTYSMASSLASKSQRQTEHGSAVSFVMSSGRMAKRLYASLLCVVAKMENSRIASLSAWLPGL